MKKIALIALVVGLLSVAGTALAGDLVYYNHHTYGHALMCSYCNVIHMHLTTCYQKDIRVMRAEAEKLKTSYHYYALSNHACDVPTAQGMRAELNGRLAEIDDWYGIRR